MTIKAMSTYKLWQMYCCTDFIKNALGVFTFCSQMRSSHIALKAQVCSVACLRIY